MAIPLELSFFICILQKNVKEKQDYEKLIE